MNAYFDKKTKKMDYYNLTILPFKVVKEDNNYTNIINNVVRRNLSWKTEPILEQKTIFDLGEIVLLSRVHFKNFRVMSIRIEISEKFEGPFVELFKDILVISGNIKVVKIGNLPCRYFRVIVTKGSPLVNFSNIDCFGLKFDKLKDKFSEDEVDLLYFNPYNFLYK